MYLILSSLLSHVRSTTTPRNSGSVRVMSLPVDWHLASPRAYTVCVSICTCDSKECRDQEEKGVCQESERRVIRISVPVSLIALAEAIATSVAELDPWLNEPVSEEEDLELAQESDSSECPDDSEQR